MVRCVYICVHDGNPLALVVYSLLSLLRQYSAHSGSKHLLSNTDEHDASKKSQTMTQISMSYVGTEEAIDKPTSTAMQEWERVRDLTWSYNDNLSIVGDTKLLISHTASRSTGCTPKAELLPVHEQSSYSVGLASNDIESEVSTNDTINSNHSPKRATDHLSIQHHGGSRSAPVLHSCVVCNHSFSTVQALEQHAKAAYHRLYICNVKSCSKSYYYREVYEKHRAKHKGKLRGGDP